MAESVNPSYGHAVLSINKIRVVKLDGSAYADLDPGQEFMIKFVARAGKLYGNDSLYAVANRIVEAAGQAKVGSLSTAALGIIMGLTPAETGSTPNRITTIEVPVQHRTPYFKIYGMAYDDTATGAMQVIVNKCKVTSDVELVMADGPDTWVTPAYEFAVVKDSNGKLFSIKQLETAADLPTS